MNALHYTKNEPFKRPAYYTAVMNDGFVVGMLEQEIDGYYYFYPAKSWSNGGFIPSWILNDLSKKLDALNERWNQILSKVLEGSTPEEMHNFD